MSSNDEKQKRQQNAAAQRRCREKKKQEMIDLKGQVDAASASTESLKNEYRELVVELAGGMVDLEVLKLRMLAELGLSPDDYGLEVVGDKPYLVRK